MLCFALLAVHVWLGLVGRLWEMSECECECDWDWDQGSTIPYRTGRDRRWQDGERPFVSRRTRLLRADLACGVHFRFTTSFHVDWSLLLFRSVPVDRLSVVMSGRRGEREKIP